MHLHEYQAKELLVRYAVPIRPGKVASSAEEAARLFTALGGHRAAVKAQVHAGGRGKAGGVALVATAAEAQAAARRLLGSRLVTAQTGPNGLPVHKVLVETACEAAREFYLGVTLDRAERCVTLIASKEGGVSIEEVARRSPQSLFRERIDPCLGLHPFEARRLAYELALPASAFRAMTELAAGLTRCFIELDCSLVEVNPLVLTPGNELVALDGKITLDDNGLFRHPELAAWRDPSQEDEREVAAHQYGLSYVALDGAIGCMVNGAGLAMATMDLIKLHGGEPANFLDVGGNATPETVTAAFEIIERDANIRAILVNIFGGIVQCDVIARGILAAVETVKLKVPLVVRLEGTNVEEGRRLLKNSPIKMTTAASLSEAARLAVELAGESNHNDTRLR